MSSEFLRTYTIPTVTTNKIKAEKINESRLKELSPIKPAGIQNAGILNLSLYVAPGKQGEGIKVSLLQNAKKRTFDKIQQSVETAESKMAMFFGRDPSYPVDLNMLIQPLNCLLCKININSIKSAKDHYESKVHNRKITAWIAENCAEKPPEVKRFLKEGPTGPNAFHCDLCDLPLTSLAHANQHYAGRKHQLVASKASQPSGAGYYNPEGKWIRQKTTNGNIPGRFGIGLDFVQPDVSNSSDINQVIPSQNTKTQIDVATNSSLCCMVCKVSVTSAGQMDIHLSGAKHRKNLARASTSEVLLPTEGISDTKSAITSIVSSNVINNDSILAAVKDETTANSDLSMYRTPTGSYYCQICNITLIQIAALQQHIQGKKHIKKENEMKSNENKTA